MQTRTLTVSAIARRGSKAGQYIPFIRLLGAWVSQAAGIQPGDKITVQASANQIIITRQ